MTELSKDALMALRRADGVSFHFEDDGHYIKVTQDERDFVARIRVNGSITDYDRQYSHVPGDEEQNYSCYFYFGSCTYSSVWHTITDTLRAGDEITLEWIGNGGNDRTKDKGLYHDMLRLRAKRQLKSGTRNMAWWVGHEIVPYSSSRMVRRRR